ncbi:MAG: rSAM-modified peptide [bacterium]|nr:rSAM-modified peptide [bacterium]
MKKSIEKKLSLSKETVSNLDDRDLKAVKGGYVTVTMDCQPTWRTTCNAIYC